MPSRNLRGLAGYARSMRIGLVSDTHLPRFGRVLPRALRLGLRAERVDLILHLGDHTAPWVADLFEPIAPFDAVAGNNDGPELVERVDPESDSGEIPSLL